MKYQESTLGSKAEIKELLKKANLRLFLNKLTVEGQCVEIPSDCELECKLKYDVTEEGGAFTLKVSWDTPVEMELSDYDEGSEGDSKPEDEV